MKKNLLAANLIPLSVAASVLIHAVIMLCARPMVMTTVSSEPVGRSLHGPSQLDFAAGDRLRHEPVRIDTVRDVAAEKDAPEAEGTTSAAALPSELERPVEAALEAPSFELPSAASVDETIVPMPEVVTAPAAVPTVREAMPTGGRLPSTGFSVLQAPTVAANLPTAPTPTPVRDVVPAAVLPSEPPVEVIRARDEPPDGAFKPIAEMMSAVDETIVEREKAAVRRLVNVEDAAEARQAVGVRLAKCESSDGFVYFRVTVEPKPGGVSAQPTALPVVPKDIVILIDASTSIGVDRMGPVRHAVKRILRSAANTGDRFNLVAFRDRYTYAFKTWQDYDANAFDRAEKWINLVVPYGWTDVFGTIVSLLTLPRDPARPLIALIITDGEATKGLKDTREIISKFTTLNDGLVSVYMYGIRSSANRELIDVLTRSNRGEGHVFEGDDFSKATARDELERLAGRFRDPVLSDLRVVFPSTCAAEAYPRLLRNLYRGGSVVLTGRVPKATAEIAFSLKGLNGHTAYEDFFRLPLATATTDPTLENAWKEERRFNAAL